VDTKGFKGNTSLNQNVPIYVSILENSDGTARISYLFLYGWNAKGPTLHVKAKMVGVGIDTTVTVGNYGFDLHYSDIEHIEVTLNKGYSSVQKIKYAYHAFSYEKTASEVEWEGNHPVVYVALGSHASYATAGDQTYITLWSEKKTEKVVVTKVTVYDTYGVFEDHCPSSKSDGKRFFSNTPRLLVLNGNKVNSVNMSNDEYYCSFKYSGRLGIRYDNRDLDGLKSAIGYSTFMKVLKTLSKSTYNKIDDAVDDYMDDAYVESSASNCFYTRGFWN